MINNNNIDNNKIDVFQIIEKYNLSIRRIPDVVYSTFDANHYHGNREGGEIYEKNGRTWIRISRIPEHKGMYMCKEVNDTDSMVRWNIKTDNIASTLEDSIKLFLSKKEMENK